MMFPIKNYKYEIPTGNALGAFGVIRKFDVHTGVDLYCQQGDEVVAMEDGIVVAVGFFTGPKVDMPWWNDTEAVAIKGKSGTINYGEVRAHVEVGDIIKEGDLLGWVIPVLKKDKGKVPSINMLHLELYTEYDGEWAVWELNAFHPINLLDPTSLLQNALIV
jgi:murein DD-endopeptidase MepM/ murein hydrolase activator NlpD